MVEDRSGNYQRGERSCTRLSLCHGVEKPHLLFLSFSLDHVYFTGLLESGLKSLIPNENCWQTKTPCRSTEMEKLDNRCWCEIEGLKHKHRLLELRKPPMQPEKIRIFNILYHYIIHIMKWLLL